jgi:hypothetical protein
MRIREFGPTPNYDYLHHFLYESPRGSRQASIRTRNIEYPDQTLHPVLAVGQTTDVALAVMFVNPSFCGLTAKIGEVGLHTIRMN